VALIVGWATPAWAPNCSGCTTSLRVSFTESVFVPSTGESVALSGLVHVVIHQSPPNPVSPPDPIRFHVSLSHASGLGEVTGLRYVAMGASRIDLPGVPTDPMFQLDLAFSLNPTRRPDAPPNPIIPLDISLLVSFSIETFQWSVEILSVSVPVD
jgi:hypothetical protein